MSDGTGGAVSPLAGLLGALADAVLIVDSQGVVAAANPRAAQLLGHDDGTLVGRPVAELLTAPASLPIDPWAPVGVPGAAPGPGVELCAHHRDGPAFSVQAIVAPATLDDGTVLVATLRGPVAGEQSAAERVAAVEELRRSNRDLEQFAYVASHDLSEPLRVIAGFVDLLARRYRGRLDEDADRFIDFIVSGVERLQALIDDLLAYSRAGRVKLERQPVDVGAVVRDVLWAVGPQLQARAVDVDVSALPVVQAEKAMLRQIFQNLISNAIKFGDADHPAIRVRATRVPAGWRFDVQDNGSGVEPRHAERVFEMFQRLHSREVPGSGMGLAIVKRLTERLGGHVAVTAAEPKGSIFSVTIPDRARSA